MFGICACAPASWATDPHVSPDNLVVRVPRKRATCCSPAQLPAAHHMLHASKQPVAWCTSGCAGGGAGVRHAGPAQGCGHRVQGMCCSCVTSITMHTTETMHLAPSIQMTSHLLPAGQNQCLSCAQLLQMLRCSAAGRSLHWSRCVSLHAIAFQPAGRIAPGAAWQRRRPAARYRNACCRQGKVSGSLHWALCPCASLCVVLSCVAGVGCNRLPFQAMPAGSLVAMASANPVRECSSQSAVEPRRLAPVLMHSGRCRGCHRGYHP